MFACLFGFGSLSESSMKNHYHRIALTNKIRKYVRKNPNTTWISTNKTEKKNKFNWTTKTNKTKQRGKNKILFVCLVRLSIYAVCRIIMKEDKFWIIILILIIIISYFIIYVCCFRKPKKSNGTGLFAWFDSNSGT